MTLVVILFIFHTFGKKATRFLHAYLYVCVWNEREKLLLQNYRGTLCRTNKNKKVSIFRGEKKPKKYCISVLRLSTCAYHRGNIGLCLSLFERTKLARNTSQNYSHTKQASCFGFANFTSNLLSFFLLLSIYLQVCLICEINFGFLSLSSLYHFSFSFECVCVCFVLLASFFFGWCSAGSFRTSFRRRVPSPHLNCAAGSAWTPSAVCVRGQCVAARCCSGWRFANSRDTGRGCPGAAGGCGRAGSSRSRTGGRTGGTAASCLGEGNLGWDTRLEREMVRLVGRAHSSENTQRKPVS